jgi:hypothetical protein
VSTAMLLISRCGRSGCHRAVEDGNGSRRFKYKLQCYGLETDSEIILTITKTVSLVRPFSAVRAGSLRITSHYSLLSILMVLYGT